MDWPNGSTSDGWQRTSAAARKPGMRSCGTAPVTVDPAPSLQLRAQGAVADERQRPLAEPLERACQPQDVLPLRQRPDAQERRCRPRLPRQRPEALEVDAAVDHLRLPAGLRQALLQQVAQVARDGDHGRGPADDDAGRGADAWDRADVRDVLAVRRDDERRAPRQRCDQAARHEEVRVDDVRPRRRERSPQEPQVPALAAAPRVDDDALELVPERGELALEVADEDAEIGRRRRGIHLRHEQDPHPVSV